MNLTSVILLGLGLFIPAFGYADELNDPVGRVILEVTGNIGNANTPEGDADFDTAMFEALETHTIETDTPWTDGLNTYEGPLFRDLYELVGGNGTTLVATALNEYSVEIPVQDILDHDVILAMRINGERMSIRDRGPLWVIYPWTEKQELRTEIIYSRSIWQVSRIEIK